MPQVTLNLSDEQMEMLSTLASKNNGSIETLILETLFRGGRACCYLTARWFVKQHTESDKNLLEGIRGFREGVGQR